jgi:hypothetical protein
VLVRVEARSARSALASHPETRAIRRESCSESCLSETTKTSIHHDSQSAILALPPTTTLDRPVSLRRISPLKVQQFSFASFANMSTSNVSQDLLWEVVRTFDLPIRR